MMRLLIVILTIFSFSEINAQRPNILWLVCEDQSSYFSFYGDSTAKTPVLDQLANESYVMQNAYVTSPVCSPSRSSIILGMHPISTGTHHMRAYNGWSEKDVNPQTDMPWYSFPQQEGVRAFTEYLRADGYYCSNNPKEDYNFNTPVLAWDESSNKAHWRNRDKGQPFFSVFNFNVCHESGIWKMANKEITVDPKDVSLPAYYPNDSTFRNDFAINYSNLERLDGQIKQVLDQLREDGLTENTFIFFYSDHGGPFPRQKRSIYQSGLKVPMTVYVPEKYRNQFTINQDELVSFVDLAPTILDLVGIKSPDHFQGRSIFDSKQAPDYVYAASDRFDEHYDRKRAIIGQDFKLILNYDTIRAHYLDLSYRKKMPTMTRLLELDQNGLAGDYFHQWLTGEKSRVELYDLRNDPDELNNLAGKEEYAGIQVKLETALLKWLEEVQDKGVKSEEQLMSSYLPGFLIPTFRKPKVSTKKGRLSINCKDANSIGWRYLGENTWNIYKQPVPIEDREIEVVLDRIGYETETFTVTNKALKD